MSRVESEPALAGREGVAGERGFSAAQAWSLFERVIAAYEAIGYPKEIVGAWAISENDVEDLVRLAVASAPGKILEVGTYVGVSTMLLALACPEAQIFTFDPDLPVRVEMSAAGSIVGEIDADLTTSEVARLAAARLGVLDRIRFVRGGFSVGETFSSLLQKDGVLVQVVGPQFCKDEGLFDLAFIDGLHSARAVEADLRLAATALRENAPIVLHDCVGFWGANVRSGVFEFLRTRPDYFFSHPQYAKIYKSVGVLRRAPDRRSVAELTRRPFAREDLAPAATQALARVTSNLLGDRAVTEIAFGVGLLADHWAGEGGYALLRLAGGLNRRSVEEAGACDGLPALLERGGSSGIFSADLLDFAPEPLLGQVLALALDRNCPLVLTSTPPGEEGVAGPFSRPVAAIIDQVERAGGAVYAHPALDLESERYALLPQPRTLGGNSMFATVLVVARPGDFTDAMGRSLVRLTAEAASEREQLELQRVHLASAFRRYFRDCADLGDSNSKAGERIRKLEADVQQFLEQLRRANDDLDVTRREQAAGARAAQELTARCSELATSLVDLEADRRRLSEQIEQLEELNREQSTRFDAAIAELTGHLRQAEAQSAERVAQIEADRDACRYQAEVEISAAGAESARLQQMLDDLHVRHQSLAHIAIEAFDALDVLEIELEQQDRAMRGPDVGADLAVVRLHHEDGADLLDKALIASDLAKMRGNARRVTASAEAVAAKIAQLEAENRDLARTLGQVTASTSWRITAPLRVARRGLGGLGAGPGGVHLRLRAWVRGRRLMALQQRLNSELRPHGMEAPVFDAEWYAQTYGDVPAHKALRHYLMYGEDEGRSPHRMFDPDFYRSQYPDVAASSASPLLHFLAHGLAEGRTPCEALYPLEDRAAAAQATPLVYYARSG